MFLVATMIIFLCVFVCMSSREVTKCYCGAANCRGTLGSGKHSPLKSTRRKSASAAKNKDRKKTDMFNDLFVSPLFYTSLISNPLIRCVAISVQLIKHLVPDRVEPSFVIFDI